MENEIECVDDRSVAVYSLLYKCPSYFGQARADQLIFRVGCIQALDCYHRGALVQIEAALNPKKTTEWKQETIKRAWLDISTSWSKIIKVSPPRSLKSQLTK